MANYKTGAQRYNDRMDKIFKKSEELGNHTLHGSTERRGPDILSPHSQIEREKELREIKSHNEKKENLKKQVAAIKESKEKKEKK